MVLVGGHATQGDRGAVAGQAPQLGIREPNVPLQAGTSSLVRRSLRWWANPEAPLALLFVGYPVWWLLGIVQVAFAVCTAVMAFRLVGRRRVLVPKGFGWWLLFLAVALLGVLAVQAEAPGTIVGSNPNRYLTWAIRFVWLTEATVVLVYVVNSIANGLSIRKLSRILSVMFVYIVAGGLVGSLAPQMSVNSLLEHALPHGITSNAFVQSKIHPLFAERQVYLENVQYRPSAPFAYANEWGLNFACFVPIFVDAWLGRGAGWRRLVAPVVLLVAIVPVIYSLNRGLWAVLILLALIVAFKQARLGRYWAVTGLFTGALLVVSVVALSPLAQTLQQRFEGHNSNQGRLNLGLRTLEAVLPSSPIVGMGTTRDVQGAFYSIAGGSTPSCPLCSPPALGTQGMIWLIIFAYGIAGLIFFLVFFASILWRHRRVLTSTATTYYCVLVAFVLTLAIYDLSVTALFSVMVAVAVLSRTHMRGGVIAYGPQPALQELRMVVSWRRIFVWCLMGGAGGILWQLVHGPTYVATASVWYPPIQTDARPEISLAATMDTQAEFLNSDRVRSTIHADAGESGRLGRDELTVSAIANTQILMISYMSSSAARAESVANSVAQDMVALREEGLADRRSDTLRSLQTKVSGFDRALALIDEQLANLRGETDDPESSLAAAGLRDERASLYSRAQEAGRQQILLSASETQGTPVAGPAVVRKTPSRWNVAVSSGILLGLVGAVASGSRARKKRPIGRGSMGAASRIPLVEFSETSPNALVSGLMLPTSSGVVLSAEPSDVGLNTVAGRAEVIARRRRSELLNGEGQPASAANAVLLARPNTTAKTFIDECERLKAMGLELQGIGICGCE